MDLKYSNEHLFKGFYPGFSFLPLCCRSRPAADSISVVYLKGQSIIRRVIDDE